MKVFSPLLPILHLHENFFPLLPNLYLHENLFPLLPDLYLHEDANISVFLCTFFGVFTLREVVETMQSLC